MAALHPSNPYYNIARHQERPVGETTTSPLDSNVAAPPTPGNVPRSASVSSQTAPSSRGQPAEQRKGSTSSQTNRNVANFRTRSIGGPWGGVYFERDVDTSPPNDDEIIIATVRVTDSFRRASVEGNSELPERPRKRNFLRRVSTRVSSPTDGNRYTALKMPRRDYKKYFARDRDGNYAGTAPEVEWSYEDLQWRFGVYQEMPLRTIPGGQEYGEGGSSDEAGRVYTIGGADDLQASGSFSESPTKQEDVGVDPMKTWSGFESASEERRESLI
ncbi:uncharacterized protein LTR77_008536 [Saxophila tyrrhenica]|uniref:Uncharacterized protein n=1 Tax=Saxophila tyrrhenica TaxID=1690608 RepID=A0AAV9P423_9PEZI|nr:hypothetical protein LTR77_008536 [Saxophila tyrrhenica]